MGLSGEHLTAASWWAFVGGSLFEVGSYLMLVESLNTGHDELFGLALWGLVSHKQTEVQSLDGKDSRSNGDDGGGRSMVKFRWM